jgi:hypothetical protein
MNELDQMDAELEALASQQRGGGAATPLPAEFSIEAVYDEAESKTQGRAVYRDVERITIHVGRDTLEREVTDADRRTYAAQYLGWKKGDDAGGIVGMPLSQWAQIPGKAVIKEFAHFGIRSVEQLATATDSTIQRIGPYLNLRQKARDWVAEAQKHAPLAKIREENESLAARVKALEDINRKQAEELAAARKQGGVLPSQPTEDPRIAEMQAQLAALAEAVQQPKRRGRPAGSKNKPKNGVDTPEA